MFTVGIDMDGVLCDFTNAAARRIKEIYNVELDLAKIKEPSLAKNLLEQVVDPDFITWGRPFEEVKEEIYDRVCNSGFFLKLEPFDSAIDAVKELYKAGCKIIFVTKPLTWGISAPEKAEWLAGHFDDIEYSLMMVDTLELKSLISLDVLVDDDPRCLGTTWETGSAIPICINRSWNEDFRKENFNILRFDSLWDAHKHILTYKDSIPMALSEADDILSFVRKVTNEKKTCKFRGGH